ncbi:MAG: hypothetical protein ABIH03_00010 [Pseudomonadota bacterium]|jgi:gold/copper resistance efflux pump|tara:strand:- start:8365 stop:8625 length:261 start_codon:yes stop_codon:yes gene_type:complete
MASVSSCQAMTVKEQLAKEVLLEGISFECTNLPYQQKLAGVSALDFLQLCVFLAYLILKMQHNRWLPILRPGASWQSRGPTRGLQL